MLQVADDPFDPRFLDFSSPERFIYGYGDQRYNHIAARVDEEDYAWAIGNSWNPNFKKQRWNGVVKFKVYLRRAVAIWEDRVKIKTISIYLHIEIMKRTGIEPPSPFHTLVDHRDGDSLNCRRSNLRWATHSMNSLNRFGEHPHDLIEG